MGALDWAKVFHQHQGWHLISCIWLHAGLIRLIVNMLACYSSESTLSSNLGLGIIYLLSVFGGSMLSALLQNHYIFVGASGALFGLFCSMLSDLIVNWTVYSNKMCGCPGDAFQWAKISNDGRHWCRYLNWLPELRTDILTEHRWYMPPQCTSEMNHGDQKGTREL